MLLTTVGRMFRDTAGRFPGRLCMETPEISYSYEETLDIAERAACALARKGVGKGSRVAVWCKDSPAFLVLYLALEMLGAIPVLLNTSLAGAEASGLMKKAGADALYYDDGFKEISFPEEVQKLGLSGGCFLPDFLKDLPAVGVEEREALRRRTDALRPEDPDVIIFTSGTSGAAKGVLSTHLARVNVARVQSDTLKLTEADKSCVAIPMFHCFGLTGVVLAALYSGGSLYFPGGRHTKQLLESVSVHGCTVFSAVPTLFSAILARLDLEQFDLSSLRTGYIDGSVYTPEFFRRVEQAMSFRLAPSLGQTEATAGLTFISPEEPMELRAPTVGRFMEGIEGQIRDLESGKPLDIGKTGEICIRGWSVMKEYVGEPELTRGVLEPDGWLHTGDLAWLDENGCIHMNGRLKELIIRGGENISPGEIEAVVGQDPRIREVKCVAVPDAHYGEEICACVVLREGASIMKEEHIRALAAERLAAYKVPRYVLFMESLPRTGSGKLALKQLKDYAAEALHLT